MKIERIEEYAEDMEQEAVRLSEKKQEVEKKMEALCQAVSRIQADAQMLSILKEKQDTVKGDQEKIKQETRVLKAKLKEVETSLSEMEKETEDSESVLCELEKIGEDVDAGKCVLEERRREIEASRASLQAVRQTLGMKEHSAEPIPPSQHLPTEKMGVFEGDRGNSAFRPHNRDVRLLMKEYGQEKVEYKNGFPDFSPFAILETPWGKMDTTVEIGHMTGQRENARWEYGRRKDSHDIRTDLGNYAQADVALCQKINERVKGTGVELTPKDIVTFREKNFTWHECEDGKTMQLIPTKIHDTCRHTGGAAEKKYEMAWGSVYLY